MVRARVTAKTAAASMLIRVQRIQEFQQVVWPSSVQAAGTLGELEVFFDLRAASDHVDQGRRRDGRGGVAAVEGEFAGVAVAADDRIRRGIPRPAPRTQENAWRHAAGLAEYISALRLHAETLSARQERDDAEAWIAWAESHVRRLNPLNGTLRLPDIPEPRADDLRPFLRGWSPYGPAL